MRKKYGIEGTVKREVRIAWRMRWRRLVMGIGHVIYIEEFFNWCNGIGEEGCGGLSYCDGA